MRHYISFIIVVLFLVLYAFPSHCAEKPVIITLTQTSIDNISSIDNIKGARVATMILFKKLNV